MEICQNSGPSEYFSRKSSDHLYIGQENPGPTEQCSWKSNHFEYYSKESRTFWILLWRFKAHWLLLWRIQGHLNIAGENPGPSFNIALENPVSSSKWQILGVASCMQHLKINLLNCLQSSSQFCNLIAATYLTACPPCNICTFPCEKLNKVSFTSRDSFVRNVYAIGSQVGDLRLVCGFELTSEFVST